MDTLLKCIIKSIRYIVFITLLFLLEVYLIGNESIFSFIIPILLSIFFAYVHEILMKSKGNTKGLFIGFNFAEDLLCAFYIIYLTRFWNILSPVTFIAILFIGFVIDYFVYSRKFNKTFK